MVPTDPEECSSFQGGIINEDGLHSPRRYYPHPPSSRRMMASVLPVECFQKFTVPGYLAPSPTASLLDKGVYLTGVLDFQVGVCQAARGL
jgi:hypothetical protein